MMKKTFYAFALASLFATPFFLHAESDIFVVDSALDTPDAAIGDGNCANTDGKCTLRAAIQEAETTQAADTITFGELSIELTSPLPEITKPLSLTGPGPDTLSINANGITTNARIFYFRPQATGAPTAFSIHGMTLVGGKPTGTFKEGGAILVRNVSSDNNEKVSLEINSVHFDGNMSTEDGGAIFVGGNASILVKNSLFTDNVSDRDGGAITTISALTVVNSTFANNVAASQGSAIRVSNASGGASLKLIHSTVTDNVAHDVNNYLTGGAISIWITASTFEVRDSIIFRNTTEGTVNAVQNCSIAGGTTVTSLGGNVSDDTRSTSGSVCRLNHPTDLIRTDPLLGGLNDNGGGTQTFDLILTSPAIGAANSCTDEAGNPLTRDQRGFSRPIGDTCDAGAVEHREGCDVTNPAIVPGSTDICDGIDNNCDGQIDEDAGAVTACGIGACQSTGVITCNGGVETPDSCVPGTPTAETCNGIDDDCDGTVDEDTGTVTTCGNGACQSTGVITCNGGVETPDSCVPGTPAAETCNGIDDDCDGTVDEDSTCAVEPGTETETDTGTDSDPSDTPGTSSGAASSGGCSLNPNALR